MQTYFDNLLASMLEENKRLATCVTTLKPLVDEAKIDCQINSTENSDNMKHSTEQNPEALQPAEKLRDAINRIELGFSDAIATNDLRLAAMELESLHARVQELEGRTMQTNKTVSGDGWKLVPVEATPEMVDAYYRHNGAGAAADWSAMVNAAPKPQADARDAERYRWLRDQGSLAEGSRHPQSWRCVAMLADMGGEHADTAIDAAIAAARAKP